MSNYINTRRYREESGERGTARAGLERWAVPSSILDYRIETAESEDVNVSIHKDGRSECVDADASRGGKK